MSTREQAGIDTAAITQEEWDAAQRMADAVNLHVLAGREAREAGYAPYVAVQLADGRSDGQLYPSRKEATRAQSSPDRFYVKVGVETMSAREAVTLLLYARRAFAAGIVFTEEETVMPQRLELAAPFIPRGLRGVGFRG